MLLLSDALRDSLFCDGAVFKPFVAICDLDSGEADVCPFVAVILLLSVLLLSDALPDSLFCEGAVLKPVVFVCE